MGRVFAIVLATYALHLAWEMGQGYLFAPMERLPFFRGCIRLMKD